MLTVKTAALFAFVALLTAGCATAPSLRTVDMHEATSFERRMMVSSVPKPQMPVGDVFVQPANKAEPCLLASSKDQTERKNFRTFWDGDCKNGYAFGLGRDIAISDTHHYEEITKHDGTAKSYGAPRVHYDYVNAKVNYVVPTGAYPAVSWFNEDIRSAPEGFSVFYTYGAADESGNQLVAGASPLRAERFFISNRQNVVYRFTDYSAAPTLNPSQFSFTAETQDPKTQVAGGVAIVRWANGVVQHLKLNGPTPEPVMLPADYVSGMSAKLKSVQDAMPKVQADVEKARQMEREYLHLACNGKHVIQGLEAETATKICTWRAQFKEPFERAQAKFAGELEQAKRQAEVTAQQRLAQQQVDSQQRQLQQQQMQQLSNSLAQIGQQARESSQQTLNNVMNQPAPQVNFAPYTPAGSNQVRCITAGIVTNCRY